MSKKRRDSKGRILRNGECQRKDGMYQFDYVGLDGKPKCVYSWKLEPTDPLPKGKRKCLSLREKEREIQKSIDDGITPYGGGLTVLELTRKYLLQKVNVRESTRTNYKTMMNILEKEDFGHKRIDKVKLSDAKEWLIKLQADGKGYSTIRHLRGIVRPAFQMAVHDDLVRKNPFDFQMAEVVVNDMVTREAITRDQKRKFLEFVKNDKHFSKYYDAIYILFYTGMRISEWCGLTLKDIDLKEKTVNIERQLIRTSQMKYIIQPPKTDAGIRVIPITDEVCECFRRIIANRPKPKIEPMIGGKTGFLFFDKNGTPMVAMHWEKYFNHIVEKYNSIYKVEMPNVTPHVCRHTYASHCATSGMNPKHLQYLMGHSDITVTMNTYTHVEMDVVRQDVESTFTASL